MEGYKPLIWPGLLALAFTPGIAIVAIIYMAWLSIWNLNALRIDSYVLEVLEFTLFQATLSTLFSLLFALPVARALARRTDFPGRGVILKLFGLPLVIPVVVTVFGITAIWGQNGLVSEFLEYLGFNGLSPLYGLTGILIAHTFFNMPLMVRLLLPIWESIPGEYWRIASMTGMNSLSMFRYIELPKLRDGLPGLVILVFLLCFTSFTIVLILGGGPKSTTIEVAIFHEVRSNFNIPKAILLALIQVGICLCVSLLLLKFALLQPGSATENRANVRPDIISPLSKINDAFWIALGCLWVGAPIAGIVAKGLFGPVVQVLGNQAVWEATLRSLMVGFGSGMIAVSLGLLLSSTTRDIAVRWQNTGLANRLELTGSQALIVSPIILGTGLFVILNPFVPVFEYNLYLATLINGFIAVPFVLRLVSPVLRENVEKHDALCNSLGLGGWNKIRIVEIPLAKKEIILAFALTTAMATGDLTSVVFFSAGRDPTLALMLYQALGNYRVNDSAVMALLLIVVCLMVFVIIERLGNVLLRS